MLLFIELKKLNFVRSKISVKRQKEASAPVSPKMSGR